MPADDRTFEALGGVAQEQAQGERVGEPEHDVSVEQRPLARYDQLIA